jgi:hypothetical protein
MLDRYGIPRGGRSAKAAHERCTKKLIRYPANRAEADLSPNGSKLHIGASSEKFNTRIRLRRKYMPELAAFQDHRH